MAWIEGEELRGFRINGESVCLDCISPEEVDVAEPLTSDGVEGWDYYFCSQCEEWVS